MPPLTRFHAACATLLLSAGCYGPMYNQPYGYPTYPGQPGAPYYPGGTVAPGGTILGPGSGTPTFDGSGSSGGNAPLYNGNSGSSTGGTDTSNRPVPNYSDPAGGSSPYYSGPGGTSGQSGATSRDRLGSASGDVEPHPAAGGNTGASPTGGFDAANPGELFEKPIDTNANPISLSREVTSAATPRYGYDPTGHAWLQGVVSFDPQDRSWGIVYSINPDAQDPYAGYLTLAQDPRFAALQDGDVIRVEGQVDPVARDQTGRSMYLVSQITPVGG